MSKSSGKTATNRPAGKRDRRAPVRHRPPARTVHRRRGSRPWTAVIVAAAVVVVFVVLYLIYRGSPGQQNTSSGGSGFTHVAGQPGIGAMAPEFTLASGGGEQVRLADFRGRSVLLYFQEGLSCQPCWDQIRDLEQNRAAVTKAGVDAVVSITTDPADLIGQKMADEKLSTSTLSDPDLRVSRAYTANQYGMMGEMRDGHSFILVGPDGTIRWRADYGGAPDYTMFLPTNEMLADLTAERTS